MGKIVAIGGGELRLGGTEKIDRYIVSLVDKRVPRLLFIPTASNDAEGYIETVKVKFGALGCSVDVLSLVSKNYIDDEIKRMIFETDIIYVGGGDTSNMLRIWRNFQIDVYLKEAYRRGVVLSGLSAGSICWFSFGHSDSQSFDNTESWEYIKVCGLELLPFAHCPHYDEDGRKSFDSMMQGEIIPGIALENYVALVEIDGQYQILKADNEKKAFILKMTESGLVKEELHEGAFIVS